MDELADPALVSRSDQSLADASAIDVDGPCMPDPKAECGKNADAAGGEHHRIHGTSKLGVVACRAQGAQKASSTSGFCEPQRIVDELGADGEMRAGDTSLP